ncbi:MAG TPA: class I SAM-dependent methyltransferase, partial [Salinivirgaceae bacterium]|nr:class I SAM-dependent methyltransferase [Salinivirgaceae bacterium]
ELEEIVRQNFEQSPFASQIDLVIGNALDILPNLNQTFDLVFIDGHKPEYCEYLKIIKPKLNHGAVILADNVLWYGKVIDNKENDASTVALRHFNDMVHNDSDFENIIIPLRDGIMMFQYFPK